MTRTTSDAPRITTSPTHSGKSIGGEAEKIGERKGLFCHYCKRFCHVINDCKILSRKRSFSNQTVLRASVLNPVEASDSQVCDKLCSGPGKHFDVVSLNVPPSFKRFCP